MSKKPEIPAWQQPLSSPAAPSQPPQPEASSEQPKPDSHSSPVEEPTAQSPETQPTAHTAAETPSLQEHAAKFLEDPAIRDAPRDKKVAFLQSKGVTPDDIEKLLASVEPVGTATDTPVEDKQAQPKTSSPTPRDIPPIVTYPEFLAQPIKPPPLITTERLLTTAYVSGGLMATLYGLSKYILAPMAHGLAEARHEFASHTKEKLDEVNTRMASIVSVDPASRVKEDVDVDAVSEAESDPTELFHRDIGTQTTPALSRRASLQAREDTSTVGSHERRLKTLKSHLEELSQVKANDSASSDSLRTKLSDLSTYLTEMSYQNHYSGMGGLYGGTYGLPKKDGGQDQIDAFKADIRAVKGTNMASTFASRLPFGGSKAPKEEDETSLTTLLSADQCADLTLLVATIMATMRSSLVHTFTAKEQDSLSETVSIADPSEKEKLNKARAEREEDAKTELAKPEVQELRTAMLAYFDEWRGQVISRIGEVVNSKEKARAQSQHVAAEKVEAGVKRQDTGDKSISSVEERNESQDAIFKELYPPFDTELVRLDEAKRALILHSLVLILLSLEHYSAHSRVLLLHLTTSLHLHLSVLKKDEEAVSLGLLEAAAHQKQMNADSETKKAAEESSVARKWKVGLASVAGAALIGVTGGLAAPLLAAGVGSVMGGLGLGATAAAGYLGTLASSSVLVGGLFGAYGGRMTGRAMEDYAKEVSDFCFIPIRYSPQSENTKEHRRLRVAIAISGWLTSEEDVLGPWRYIDTSIEGFALRYELDALLRLGNSMETFVKSYAWNYAKGQIIKRTVFGALTAGLWPLGLLKVASVLDNPFSVAKARADKAGEVLADALINKAQGERPVTLVGYSLGARLIFSCLQSLAKRKAFGLVEHVALLGAPTPSDAEDWRRVRSVVSGRVINVFSTDDYILGFLYRTSSIQLGVAGLQPVMGVHGVQNVDVSEVVSGHLRYRYLTGSILKKIGFEDIDLKEVEKAEREMRALEERERMEVERREQGGEKEGDEERELTKEVEVKMGAS
ncbi:DUF726-domain-containing protein [Sporormia fimetaria CBS 119925]|uniref:DUF726-domain-containing protein n=1 Tax=Sporormia fimetaria CBS 119925 TaxID=1340428 RepID=A0A6A6V701_9PLEO|nr:DUF726-domain-containing protein [Sporormia fimetaria CBS 119925]